MKGFLVLFLMTNFLTAQKVIKKSVLNSNISSIQIDASNCFEMNIENNDTDAMIVIATIDGEYKSDLILNVKEEGISVLVSAGFQPNFENPNDKLSVHKVISIAIDIRIPKNKNVNVFGTSCNVTANGIFEKLKITLNDGSSTLLNVSGLAEITSQSGNISVKSQAAEIICNSKYGKIEGDQIPKGNNKYTLSTITGNILLKRMK